jgi:phospholipid transport system substrate-binding protein
MKNILLALAILLLPSIAMAATPTESLREAIDSLLSIAGNAELDKGEKKLRITELVKKKIDLQVVSQRVVSRHWKKADKAQKAAFIDLFTQVVVNTYSSLLSQYTNEKVEYLKEVIKKVKFAKVSTNIVLANKKVPVIYKLINRKGQWRIYDFSAEGVSLISTYTNDYKSTLKRGGLAALNQVLSDKLAKSASTS